MNRIRHSVTLILAAAIVFTFAAAASAAPTGKLYDSPEKAVEAFVAAMRHYDLETLVSIFGKGSESLFETADPVADQTQRTNFLELYDQKHSLVPLGEVNLVLIVGNDAWPLPMPIVKQADKFGFDAAAGLEELINRRVGRNELDVIQTCLAIADAQREYYLRDRDGDGILEYAQRFRSTIGLRDGLFWRADEGESPSPLGEFAARAADEGYTATSDAYHGYRFKGLTAQGPNAPGGAYDYMARDNQIGGFALLAYPASYGDSGVMTFMVSHDFVVYQKDLGEATAAEAQKITTFDPGEGWTKVEDKDLEPLP